MANEYASNSQAQLLAAIYKNSDDSFKCDSKALDVYRHNLYASAVRALEISYPTLFALCGAAYFRTLAIEYLHRHPFKEGDWGVWGSLVSEFLRDTKTLDGVHRYPYFSSVAELDWQVHLSERAEDQQLDAASFELLGSPNADSVQLVLSPLVRVLVSAYPIVDIYAAHQQGGDSKSYMAMAREKIASGIGQTAVVYRPLYKVCVEACSDSLQPLFKGLADGLSFGEIAAYAQTLESFDFEAWLTQSVEKRIILGVKP